MHRLFWKIFLSFWAALILFSAFVMLAASHYLDEMREHGGTINPFVQLVRLAAQAQTAATRDGTAGLIAWAHRTDRCVAVPILVVDNSGRDILGRQVPERITEHLLREAQDPPQRASDFRTRTTVHVPQGPSYRVYPDFEGVTLGRILSRPRVIEWPLAIAALVSGLVCFLLVRYLVGPVERLQHATEALAGGDLRQRVGPSLGRRRDEIADLAHSFDRMAERLDTLIRSQKQLLTDVSHELRSPLARLQAALGLARQRTGEKVQPELNRIDREAERLNDLIGQLLSLARLESGVYTPKKEPVDLNELLTTVVGDARLEAQARHRQVHLESDQGPVTVHANPPLLHSVFENVVRNGIRYTADRTAVTLSLHRDTPQAGWVEVRVRDHGPGVPEKMLARLFEPFVRVGDDRDRGSDGHGLGLAIAERAARLHGGEIFARNEPDGGLMVVVRLPGVCA